MELAKTVDRLGEGCSAEIDPADRGVVGPHCAQRLGRVGLETSVGCQPSYGDPHHRFTGAAGHNSSATSSESIC